MEEFKIKYPSNHTIQQAIVSRIESVSSVSFSNCAGFIDGLFKWIEKSSKEQAKRLELKENNLLWKNTFGLNC